ncbi:hypothetical protein JW823_05945 [bacterium]|nr:hypothetical protein [candidate division CSSED10-310 bacterium]
MRNFISCIVVIFLTASVLAWEDIPVFMPVGNIEIIDFIVPESGPFADCPLLLCAIDNWTYLFRLTDPTDPRVVGQFPNQLVADSVKLQTRLICDNSGYPILVEMNPGRCNIIRYEPGGWLPKRNVQIGGTNPCIALNESGDLIVDYFRDFTRNFGSVKYSLYRSVIDMTDWSVQTETVTSAGSRSDSDYTVYHRAPYFYVRYGSEIRSSGHYSICVYSWEVSMIPESHRANFDYPYSQGKMQADYVSDTNWVAAYADGETSGNDEFEVKSIQSDLYLLGHLHIIAVDASRDGNQYAAYQNREKAMEVMTCVDGQWSQPETLGDYPYYFQDMKLAVANDNMWILYVHETGGYHLITNVEQQGTPTQTPAPTFTPLPERAFLEIYLSSIEFQSDQWFTCDLWLNNPSKTELSGLPLFMLLEVHGNYYFGPEFTADISDYSSLIPSFSPGYTEYKIIPGFWWPDVAAASGIRFLTAILNADYSNIVSNVDIVEFGWQ